MTFETLLYEVADGVATLTLHRPERMNAYTTAMGDEIVAAFDRIRADDNVRAVILTGAGRAFCAGVDLEALAAHRASGGTSTLGEERFLREFPLELQQFPKPVIAAINGAAIGVGVTMTLPCDIRLAADGAKLGLTFVKLGLLPGLGSTHLLPRLIGPARASELVLTGRVILAAEAAAIGLVNRVVPADLLMKEARELACAMASVRPEVLAAAKQTLHLGASASMVEALEHERAASARLRQTS